MGVASAVAPLESEAQRAYFEWLSKVPVPGRGEKLRAFAFAVPNGAILAGNAAQRGRYMNFLKGQGLTAGVSDIVIALPMGQYHGAYLEMKRDQKSKCSPEQQDWLDRMASVGYYAARVSGLDDAIKHTVKYMKGKP
jgi:hypothetical protein